MPPPPNLLGYPDMVPPSYAPAVKQNKASIADDNDQHTFGNLSYVPVYTYAQPSKKRYFFGEFYARTK